MMMMMIRIKKTQKHLKMKRRRNSQQRTPKMRKKRKTIRLMIKNRSKIVRRMMLS